MKTKTALAVTLVFLVFVEALAVISLRYFEDRFEETVYKQQMALVSSVAQSADTKLTMAREALAALARDISPELLRDPDKAQAFLDRQRPLLSIFDNGLYLILENGRVLAEAPFIAGGRGRDVSKVDVFKGVSTTREPYISRPFVSVRAQGRPVISIGIPLFASNGEMIGRFHGSVELMGKNFLADLIDTKVGETGYLFLSTVDRTMILHPNRSRIMSQGPPAGQNQVYDRSLQELEGSGRTVTSLGVRMLVSFQRIPSTNWVLGVNYPEAEAFAPFYEARRTFIWLLTGGTVAVLGVVWLLMRRLTRPLESMTAHVASLSGKQGEARFLHSGARDEIGVLSQAFDRMLGQLDAKEQNLREVNTTLEERVSRRTSELEAANDDLKRTIDVLHRTQDHLVQAEKMSALGGLVAGVAHEINTPLGIGVTAASHLELTVKALAERYQSGAMSRDDLTSFMAAASESTAMVLSNLQRAAELIRSFKQVAVDQSGGHRRQFYLKEYLQEVLRSLSPQLSHTRHQISLSCPDELQLYGDPGAISQIITNLVMNSLIHGFEGVEAGHMAIEVSGEPGGLLLRYKDDGRGIAEEHLAHIFEPFFTTRRGQGGSGLGLHVIYNIITQGMAGSIQCTSTPGQGVVFDIHIPHAAVTLAGASPTEPA
ncbi:MAG: ATP-binding protein [Hylemonella sp.]|nr:ATP-binding protein [Hylemonella sp.]